MKAQRPEPKHKPPASGHKEPTRNRSMTKVVCLLDDDTFAEVRGRAIRQKTSFAEQLRQLVEWGLMADEA